MIPEVGREGGALQGPPGQSEEGMWGGAGLSSGGKPWGEENSFSPPLDHGQVLLPHPSQASQAGGGFWGEPWKWVLVGAGRAKQVTSK